tara:strand:- start:922 stop:1113 length:192 start_codon:yes stop_codon:yes gene_type:complete
LTFSNLRIYKLLCKKFPESKKVWMGYAKFQLEKLEVFTNEKFEWLGDIILFLGDFTNTKVFTD